MPTPASPATVARAHKLADELGRALTLADFCEVVARPDFASTLHALEQDGGYPETVKSMREAAKICRQYARPGAAPGQAQRKPGARAVAPPGGGAPGGKGKAETGPAKGASAPSPGAHKEGAAAPGSKGTLPGGRSFGPDLGAGVPWLLFAAIYVLGRTSK